MWTPCPRRLSFPTRADDCDAVNAEASGSIRDPRGIRSDWIRALCRSALFESRIVDKKLDVVGPCKGMIAEGVFH